MPNFFRFIFTTLLRLLAGHDGTLAFAFHNSGNAPFPTPSIQHQMKDRVLREGIGIASPLCLTGG